LDLSFAVEAPARVQTCFHGTWLHKLMVVTIPRRMAMVGKPTLQIAWKIHRRTASKHRVAVAAQTYGLHCVRKYPLRARRLLRDAHTRTTWQKRVKHQYTTQCFQRHICKVSSLATWGLFQTNVLLVATSGSAGRTLNFLKYGRCARTLPRNDASNQGLAT